MSISYYSPCANPSDSDNVFLLMFLSQIWSSHLSLILGGTVAATGGEPVGQSATHSDNCRYCADHGMRHFQQ